MLAQELDSLWRRHWHTITVLAVFLTIIKVASQPAADTPSFLAGMLVAFVVSLAVSLFFHWVFRTVVDHLANKVSE